VPDGDHATTRHSTCDVGRSDCAQFHKYFVVATDRRSADNRPGMAEPASMRTTQLIDRARAGDSSATTELLSVVYEELRRMARSQMGRERAGNTLQPTALVHEAYLRLLGDGDVQWNSRAHFFGAAAHAMRRILVERARSRGRPKRGGDRARADLDDELEIAGLASEPQDDTLLDIDDVLKKLEGFDQQKANVVMLRYFAGLSIEQTAAALDLSFATVRAEWALARAWMPRELAR